MKKAFTMIELIFVIVILGVLAAIAVPKLSASAQDAKMVKDIENLRTLMSDLTTYYVTTGTFAKDFKTMSNVNLDGGSSDTAYFYIKPKSQNVNCLKFQIALKNNEPTGVLKITAMSGQAQCSDFLEKPALVQALSGKYECSTAYDEDNTLIPQSDTFDQDNGMAAQCAGESYKSIKQVFNPSSSAPLALMFDSSVI